MDTYPDTKIDFLKDNIRYNLIECRKEHGLTQTEVGEIVGKSKTAVASWEQGLSTPDAVTLYRLATYYHKTMEWMYECEGEAD